MIYKKLIPISLKKPLPSEELNQLLKSKDIPKNREKIILHNLRLVSWVAYKYHVEDWTEYDDLFQAGVIGLMKAIDKYDPEKGTFANYAVWWIKRYITRYLHNHTRNIRIPIHMIERINEINKVIDEMTQELGREPTTKDISDRTGMSIKTINEMLSYIQDPISLQTTIELDSDDVSLEEVLADDGPTPDEIALDSVFISELVKEVKSSLTEIEYKVFVLFSGITGRNYTVTEISRMLGKSREWIQQVKNKVISKIAHSDFIRDIERKVDEETLYYKSPVYFASKVKESQIDSPVERIVLKREDYRQYLINKYIKTG